MMKSFLQAISGEDMTRTQMPRTLLCGALTVAALMLLAGCGTLSTRTGPQTVLPTYQTQQQLEVAPPKTESSKLELTVPDQPAIDYWTRRFSGEKHKSFQIQLDRARDYVVPCQEIFRQQGLPEDLVYVALVESGFTPTARSHANAVGMFQFISTTGKRYRLEQNQWIDERRHPFKAARAAGEYLSFLYDTFGSWPLALAGYNCGEKAVQAALDQSGLKTFWELARSGYLPAETREYVPKFYATIRIARDSNQYGFHFAPQHYTPKHETVSVPGGLKLSWLEKRTGVPESSLRNCNPELCQAVTPPGELAYDLCVPIGTGESVQAALTTCPLPTPAEEPAAKALAFKNTGGARGATATALGSCTVKPGDTWFSLARKYQCSVDALASLNGLKPSPQSLKTGQTLKIPANGQIVLAAAKKGGVEKQPSPIAIPAKASRPAQKSCLSYPVRLGDTLWSIAGKFHVSVEELSAHNKLGQGQKLVAGNTLTICSYTSQLSGEGMGRKKN
jgi:membrane-bound lytic murein transglycosylase D